MKSVSSFGNNQNPINDRESLAGNGGYQPSYLAKAGKNDEVSFSGKRAEAAKAKGFKGMLIGLAALLGLTGCSGPVQNISSPTSANSVIAETQPQENLEETKDNASIVPFESSVPVVTIISTEQSDDVGVEDKEYPSILAIMDDHHPEGGEANSTVKVINGPTNEVDECQTLLESINKVYTEPFINNGGDPGEVEGAVLDQIAAELIENNEDMQKKIAEYFEVDNWKEADIHDVLDADLYEMGVTEFSVPDIVKIHGVSTVSHLYDKSESASVAYGTSDDTIVLDNSIKTLEDLYAAFAEKYADVDGNQAGATAASLATLLTIEDNQYNEAFDGKINNDGDRTAPMLLKTLSELGDGETLELEIPDTVIVNLTTSGKALGSVPTDTAYHMIHQMTPSETSFTLPESVSDLAGLKNDDPECMTGAPYDFVDIAMYYSDMDTLEPYATKTQDEDGNYVFKFNTNVADLNAKTYSLYEQYAFRHIDFFASTQEIDMDGENKEYEYGVFDVKEGYEDTVAKLFEEGNYDEAKKYLVFNLDRFKNGSFYNEDGTLKTGVETVFSLEQYRYISEDEGTKVELPEKETEETSKPDPEKPADTDSDSDTDIDTDTDIDIDVDTDTDTDIDTDVDNDTDTDIDNDIDNDTDTDIDNDTDNDVDNDTDTDIDNDVDNDTDVDNDADNDIDNDTDVDNDADNDVDNDTDTDVDNDTDTDVDNDTDTDVDNDADNDVDNDADNDADNDTDNDNPNPDVDDDSDSDTDIDNDVDTDVDNDTDTDVDNDADNDVDNDADNDVDNDTDNDNPNPDVDNDSDSDTDIDNDIDNDTDTDVDNDADNDTDTDTDVDNDTDNDTDTDVDNDADNDIDNDADNDCDPELPIEPDAGQDGVTEEDGNTETPGDGDNEGGNEGGSEPEGPGDTNQGTGTPDDGVNNDQGSDEGGSDNTGAPEGPGATNQGTGSSDTTGGGSESSGDSSGGSSDSGSESTGGGESSDSSGGSDGGSDSSGGSESSGGGESSGDSSGGGCESEGDVSTDMGGGVSSGDISGDTFDVDDIS